MRDLINLVEGARSEVFYHASENELPIGTVLEPRNRNMVDEDIEEILEKYRPKSCLPRAKSVFMSMNRRDLPHLTIHGESYIYAVEPKGKVWCFDHAWVNEIWRLIASTEDGEGEMTPQIEKKIKRYAYEYWRGSPYVGGRRMVEYACRKAVVTTEISVPV